MYNKLILGTVQFGLNYGINNNSGQMSEKEVFRILDLVHTSQILTLDTAAAYGNSEQRIGRYLHTYPEKNNFRVITKLSLKDGATPIESLDRSLNNLMVNQVDTIMFHDLGDFERLKSNDMDEFFELKGSKYFKMGVSLYTNEQVDRVCELNLFDVVQLPFNVFDNHRLRAKTLEKLKKKSIETHTRSVFLQGLFFMDIEKVPKKLTPLIKNLSQFEEIAAQFEVEKASLALHYALSKPYIDGVLIGVDSASQMVKNISMLEYEIPKEALSALENIEVRDVNLLNPSFWNQ